MGRKRNNPLNLPDRVYAKHGAFYYVHLAGNWEHLGTDIAQAKRIGNLYNDPGNEYGTMAYWLKAFIEACRKRVDAKSLAPRTLQEYSDAIIPLTEFFGKMIPAYVEPAQIGRYLDIGLDAGRGVSANREKACLSACFTWLMRQDDAGVKFNPCKGVRRNPEKKKDVYIEDAQYHGTIAKVHSNMVKALAGLIYRTLQRPCDIQRWTAANIIAKNVDGAPTRILSFIQSKTGALVQIRITPEIDECFALARKSKKKVTGMTLIHQGNGKPYAEKSLSLMFAKARREAGYSGFGIYDLKGKGATDMWLSKVPMSQIQVLCGHKSVTTTERYVKCRWRGVVEPNVTVMSEAKAV